MTGIDQKTEQTLTLACDELLKQLQSFRSLDEWWSSQVLSPTIKRFFQQFVALSIVEGVIVYTHNWVAAFLCGSIMLSLIYQTFVSLSMNKLVGFLVLRGRDAFEKGLEAGESKVNSTV